jgi:hypothetical protein
MSALLRAKHTTNDSQEGVELTILMPCLNEAETLETCIAKANSYLQKSGVRGEVLIADNGSSDGSPDIAKRLGARVVNVRERGYGAALIAGIEAARGRFVIMGDADDSYEFSDLSAFVSALRDGNELVMGNRFRGGIKPGAMPPLHRYLGNPVLSTIGRVFFRSPIGDFHCGLRGFDRQAISNLGLTSPGMEFASEMVVKATLRKLKITEVPTTLSPDGRSRPPHLRSWRDGWRHLRFLMLFSPRWLFLYPGILLSLVGIGSMLWLIPGPRTVGDVTLDINTLAFACAAAICGIQSAIFSVFATVFAADMGLLPVSKLARRFAGVATFEFGMVLGGVLLVFGLAGAGFAVGIWGRGSFGNLDPSVSMRIVLPAVTALILGVQFVFSSFFLSILDLPNRGIRRERIGPSSV